MGIAAVGHVQVQRDPGVHGKRAEEFAAHAGVEPADALLREYRVEHQIGPPANVHRRRGERFIHRQKKAAVARNAALITERLTKGPAQHDARILNRVVAIHLQVAFNGHLKPEAAVHGEGLQHVVKKADARIDCNVAAVQIEAHSHARFLRAAHLFGSPHISNHPFSV